MLLLHLYWARISNWWGLYSRPITRKRHIVPNLHPLYNWMEALTEREKKERRFNYFLHCIYYKCNRKLNPLPNAAQQLFWPSRKFVEDHSKLSCYRRLSVLSSWEKWIRIITDVNHIGFSCYFKDHCSQKSSQICWQVRVQLVLLPLADSLAPGNTRSEQPQSSCLCRQGGIALAHHATSLCPALDKASPFSEAKTAIWETLWPKAILTDSWAIFIIIFLSLPADGCP